jgi:O-antigen/teichoic acid export membrane protein
MTPSLAREHRLDPERVRRWVRTSIYWIVLLVAPAGVGLSLVAGRVIDVLYGGGFASAAPVLAIIAWDIPFFILLAFFGNVTAATGRERPAAAIYLVSAGLNLVLNLAFIPLYGIYAAASITVLSDLLTVGIFLVLLRDMLQLDSTSLRDVLRVAAATLIMGLGIWFARELPLVVVILLGGLIYLGIAICLRLIDPHALVSATRQILRRMRPQQSAV